MFKLTESENLVRTLAAIEVPGCESIPANATVPKGHRLWATYEAWLAAGNVPEPFDTRTAAERRALQKIQIDTAAGRARDRFISPGVLIDQEYLAAEQAATAFRDAGYPEDAMPLEVQTWADATGWSPEHAAEDIIATGAAWRHVLAHIRGVRLMGKARIDAAPEADIEATAEAVIEQLNRIVPA